MTKGEIVDTPFEFGKTYWLPVTSPTPVTMPCQACYGNRAVTVILGNGEQVSVACEACGKGFSGPMGTEQSFTYEPSAKPFTVSEVTWMSGSEWTLKSQEGHLASFDRLVTTPGEALELSKVRIQECVEANMKRSAANSRHSIENSAWSVRYHEKCIKDAEKSIAWHRSKVSERKGGK